MADTDESESLRQLLHDGWANHDKDSEHLARELEAAAQAGLQTDLIAPFLHLSTHTIGEHLGDWSRALRLGKHVLDGRTPTYETAQAWRRLYVAAVLADAWIEAAHLELSCLKASGSDFGAALLDMRFMVVGALVASKRVREAGRLYRSAIGIIEQISPSAFLDRTIAATSNNLGWELFEMSSRSPDEDALMSLCAETSLAFWLKCGNWVNEERALYFRALVSNVVGNPRSALTDVDKALAVIHAQGERPLDAALLHLVRASALAALGDKNAMLQAIAGADAAASPLKAPELKAQFDAERAKVVAVA
jgi:hypothetical protein